MIAYLDDLPRTAELVIVGGGIIGAATAFHARRAGFEPLILERRPALCTLTTAVAAGGFRLQLDAEDELALVRESVELYASFEEETGQREHDARVREQGYLWLTTTERGAEGQRRLVEAQRGWGVDGVELLDGDECRARFPFVGPHVIQARFRQRDGLLDPAAATFGLASGARANVLTRCGVTGFALRGDVVTGVETERGTIATERVVVACGPLSGVLAATAGVELPIRAVKRHRLVVPNVPQVPAGAPMTIDEDSGAHWRPAHGGAYALFTDPATAPSPPEERVDPEPGFPSEVLDPTSPSSLARVVPFWREVWERGTPWLLQAGQYTMTPDRRPLLGATAVGGLFVNTGYSGHGVMAGPAGSRILVDVLTGALPAGADPFRPDRAFGAAHEGVL